MRDYWALRTVHPIDKPNALIMKLSPIVFFPASPVDIDSLQTSPDEDTDWLEFVGLARPAEPGELEPTLRWKTRPVMLIN